MGIHTFIIAVTIGVTPTGMRDLVIAGAFFALAFLHRK